MAEDKPKFIHGFLIAGEEQFAFVSKYDERLLKYLKLGKMVKAVDLALFYPNKGELHD